MADCVSLPNTAELVERLRSCAIAQRNYEEGITPDKFLAADAIEQLMQENARLKAERDALLERIVGLCSQCKYQHTDMSAEPCFSCDGSSNWEWRGVKEEEA